MNLCELADICTGPERAVFALVCIAVFVIGLSMCGGYERVNSDPEDDDNPEGYH